MAKKGLPSLFYPEKESSVEGFLNLSVVPERLKSATRSQTLQVVEQLRRVDARKMLSEANRLIRLHKYRISHCGP